ncbi:glycosyltransferase family 39 protein [Rhodovibrionaceae bacterium A322]
MSSGDEKAIGKAGQDSPDGQPQPDSAPQEAAQRDEPASAEPSDGATSDDAKSVTRDATEDSSENNLSGAAEDAVVAPDADGPAPASTSASSTSDTTASESAQAPSSSPDSDPPFISPSSGAGVITYFFLLVMALGLFLPGFFELGPIDRDESRFAQATQQMLDSGDFVDIRFQDEPRHKKPAGIYWMQAAAVKLLSQYQDVQIWMFRVPSLIGATLSVLLTAWIGGFLFNRRVAFLAGSMMAGCLLLGVEARMAKTDAMQLAFILLAQGALAKIYLAEKAGAERRRGPAYLFWFAQGVAFLLKGPLALLVSGGTLLFLIGAERRIAWLKRLEWGRGLLLFLLIAAPWYIAITIETQGAFFEEALGRDLLGKVASGQESHGAPPGYYFGVFWLTFWPFSLLAGLVMPDVWRQRKMPAVLFCFAWVLLPWLIFELVPTKLPHYVLPTYPAIALLAAAGMLLGWGDNPGKVVLWRRRILLGVFLLVTFLLMVAIPAVFWVAEGQPNLWSFLGLLGPLAILIGLVKFRNRLSPNALYGLCLGGATLLFVTTYQWVLPNLSTVWLSPRIVTEVNQLKRCEQPSLTVAGYGEPSLVFLFGKEVHFGNAEAVGQQLIDDGRCGLALVSEKYVSYFKDFMTQAQAPVEVVGSLSGINYSKGKPLNLTFYQLVDAPSSPAVPVKPQDTPPPAPDLSSPKLAPQDKAPVSPVQPDSESDSSPAGAPADGSSPAEPSKDSPASSPAGDSQGGQDTQPNSTTTGKAPS